MPQDGRRSETYCPECRENGKAYDLFQRLIDAGHVDTSSGFTKLKQPVFRLTEAMVRSKSQRETERTLQALERLGITLGNDSEEKST